MMRNRNVEGQLVGKTWRYYRSSSVANTYRFDDNYLPYDVYNKPTLEKFLKSVAKDYLFFDPAKVSFYQIVHEQPFQLKKKELPGGVLVIFQRHQKEIF